MALVFRAGGALMGGELPAAVGSSIRLEFEAMDTGYLYLQLRDDDWGMVCDNVTDGNLLGDTGGRVVKSLEVPLERYPEATVLILQRLNGAVEIFRTTLTPTRPSSG